MKTAECGRIKNLYEQRGPWHRSVSGCRKKDARLVVAKDEAQHVGTLRTRALAMPKACREPFAVIYGARNGTSHSARTRV
jgi:hypothetical protein